MKNRKENGAEIKNLSVKPRMWKGAVPVFALGGAMLATLVITGALSSNSNEGMEVSPAPQPKPSPAIIQTMKPEEEKEDNTKILLMISGKIAIINKGCVEETAYNRAPTIMTGEGYTCKLIGEDVYYFEGENALLAANTLVRMRIHEEELRKFDFGSEFENALQKVKVKSD